MQKRKSNKTFVDRFYYEGKAREDGFKMIAGIDEAGRGPLAGPVVASAVIVKDREFEHRVDDSKKISPSVREKAFIEIMEKCYVGIGSASVEEIDRINIFNATLLAMKRAVEELSVRPDFLLIDGKMEVHLPQPKVCLIRGESLSFSVACASIIAKVFRDKIMVEQDVIYPEYNFKQHKGYGTKEHIENIRNHGLSTIHRKSFGPFGSKKKSR